MNLVAVIEMDFIWHDHRQKGVIIQSSSGRTILYHGDDNQKEITFVGTSINNTWTIIGEWK